MKTEPRYHYEGREPHQCERCGNNLRQDEETPHPLPTRKEVWLCAKCIAQIDKEQEPVQPVEMLKITILQLLVTPWEQLKQGEVITARLVSRGSNWIKVEMPISKRIKTLFNFEAKCKYLSPPPPWCRKAPMTTANGWKVIWQTSDGFMYVRDNHGMGYPENVADMQLELLKKNPDRKP